MNELEEDPVFLNSRREAIVIAGLWFAALLWTVPYCYTFGYQPPDDPEQLQTVMGMPSWVFWGIAAPWGVCSLATIFLCLSCIRDDDLGEAPEDAEPEQSALSVGDLT